MHDHQKFYTKTMGANSDKYCQQIMINNSSREWTVSEITLSMPTFSFSKELKMEEYLKRMEMTDLFDPDKADLSKVSNATESRLAVTSVLHLAKIEVRDHPFIM